MNVHNITTNEHKNAELMNTIMLQLVTKIKKREPLESEHTQRQL